MHYVYWLIVLISVLQGKSFLPKLQVNKLRFRELTWFTESMWLVCVEHKIHTPDGLLPTYHVFPLLYSLFKSPIILKITIFTDEENPKASAKNKSLDHLNTQFCCCSVAKACPALSLCYTISWSLHKLMSIESVMPSNHLILCHPLLLQSFWAPWSFPVSQLLASDGQSIGASWGITSRSHAFFLKLKKKIPEL